MSDAFWFWAALPFFLVSAGATFWMVFRRNYKEAVPCVLMAVCALFVAIGHQASDTARYGLAVIVLILTAWTSRLARRIVNRS